MKIHGKILVIAGSDSGGGAGLQADIKTITALGGFAMTAVTAVTAQNSQGVVGGAAGVFALPPDFVAKQIQAVWHDLGVDVVKIGMLGDRALIASVLACLADCDVLAQVPIVLDPVMVAKGGQSLLPPEAVQILRDRALPRATILTPNIPEAEFLTGMACQNLPDRRKAALALLAMMQRDGAIDSPKNPPKLRAVLLKGGHAETAPGQPSDMIEDLLLYQEGGDQEGGDAMPHERIFTSPRISTPHTHGTGCSLASAIATFLAQNYGLEAAVAQARNYVHLAIAEAPGFGHSHGPLNHAAGLVQKITP